MPNEVGHADFAAAWDLTEPGTIALVGAAPDVPPGIAEKFAQTIFHNADEIDGFSFSSDRINSSLGSTQRLQIKEIGLENRFMGQICTKFCKLLECVLSELPTNTHGFIVYMSVFINEYDGPTWFNGLATHNTKAFHIYSIQS